MQKTEQGKLQHFGAEDPFNVFYIWTSFKQKRLLRTFAVTIKTGYMTTLTSK